MKLALLSVPTMLLLSRARKDFIAPARTSDSKELKRPALLFIQRFSSNANPDSYSNFNQRIALIRHLHLKNGIFPKRKTNFFWF